MRKDQRVGTLRRVLAGALGALALSGSMAGNPMALATERRAEAGPGSSAGTQAVPLASGGLQRSYRLHLSPRDELSTLTQPRPLVIALHGRYQSALKMEQYTGLDALADQQGFAVAYGQAWGGGWNAGTCCSTGYREQIDDTQYLLDLIKDAKGRAALDPARIYVVGFSSGGMMAYRFGCEHSEQVAGIGVVGGAVASTTAFSQGLTPPRCQPSTPVSLIHVHGAEDQTVPERGGYVPALETSVTATYQSVADWARADGCATGTLRRAGQVEIWNAEGCQGGNDVQWARLRGGGHTWNHDAQGYATDAALWKFLSVHHRKDLLTG